PWPRPRGPRRATSETGPRSGTGRPGSPQPRSLDHHPSRQLGRIGGTQGAGRMVNLCAAPDLATRMSHQRVLGDLISYRKDGNPSAATASKAGSVSEHSASRIDMCAGELTLVKPGAPWCASGLEQGGELLGVDLGVVAVAVVEQHVRFLGVAGQGAHLGRPLLQLGIGVAVAEPLVDVAAVPLVGVAMHA